jgi:protein SDA1
MSFHLVQLQNLCKRDPESYEEEFRVQYRHFISLLAVLQAQSVRDASDEFVSIVTFLSHVRFHSSSDILHSFSFFFP